MTRYLIKFEKGGQLRYISHLDLLRLFRRTFKRAGVDLVYSRGFNPHPKMSFAQPLSLGYTSIGEYLEFETTMPYLEDILVASLNSLLPYGIKILSCAALSPTGKTAASMVTWAAYEVNLPEGHGLPDQSQVKDFLNLPAILVVKDVRKRKERVEIDIKPMIRNLERGVNEEGQPTLNMVLGAGSESNLNPILLLHSLFSFCEIPLLDYEPQIKRLQLYDGDGQPLSKEL